MSAVSAPPLSRPAVGRSVGRAVAGALRGLVSGATWRATAQLIGGMFAGVVTFTIIVSLLAVSLSTVVILPAAVVVSGILLVVSPLLGRAERYRARTLLDLDLPSPHRRETGRWFWQRHWARLGRASTWKEIGYHLLRLPLGTFQATLAIAVWCGPLTLAALPAYVGAMPHRRIDLWAFTVGGDLPVLGTALLGVVALLFVPTLIATLAALDRWVIRTLLGPSQRLDLTARVAELETSRSGVVDAAEAERRRIERDLHDGAQQRLVALAMDLGMAREKLATDPARASQLLDEAHAEAKQALVELRNLARGIHPAVLTDRGLDAALSAVAARSPVPVDLTIDVARRPGPSVEGTAYFIVSEALTNVAKHSGATRATVNVARRGNRLVLEIADNGHGGADPALGTGLAGLRDRVAGVDGWFHVSSPLGGPTTLLVELPCAS